MGISSGHGSASVGATNGKTQDVFQKIVSSRKCYKMLKGATEAVWPPDLEEALLKGLESHEPADCMETRLLGRFPMRNQYISDFIYRATGKRRTAKQVGSRLQQLRDTPEGKPLLNSLQHYNKPQSIQISGSLLDAVRDYCPSSDSPISTTSSDSSTCSPAPLASSVGWTFVCIDVLPMGATSLCSSDNEDQCRRTSSAETVSSNAMSNVFRPSSRPRPICCIDPTVTFISQSAMFAESSCSVLLDGETVHHEATPLTLAGSCPDSRSTVDCQLLYSVQLVPNYWQFLVQSPDLTRYTIVQRVARLTNITQAQNANGDSTVFSAVYNFCYAATRELPIISSVSSSPVFRQNSGAEAYVASDLENGRSKTGYSDSMGTSALSDATASNDLMATSRGDCGTSKEIGSEDAAVVPPILSFFPVYYGS